MPSPFQERRSNSTRRWAYMGIKVRSAAVGWEQQHRHGELGVFMRLMIDCTAAGGDDAVQQHSAQPTAADTAVDSKQLHRPGT